MSFDPWTLGFQAVNVIVLVWLLQRFFWKPVAGMIDARQAQAGALLDEAASHRAQAEAGAAEVAATRAGMSDERDAVLASARAEAETAREALLDTARAEADSLRDTAKAARVRAAVSLKATANDEAQALAVSIAGRLLGRLGSAARDLAFLDWLIEALSALPDAQRIALAGAPLEVVSASPADPALQARITQALGAVLGAPPVVTFRTDPDLIAGIEIHGPHVSLRNSWAADLARICEAMADAA